MKKILGILALLIVIVVFTSLMTDNFFTPDNFKNIMMRTSLYAILGIGVAFVIITGGIDLSIGSVVGLIGCLLPWLLVKHGWGVWTAIPFVMFVSLLIGIIHGLLITKLKLQPFVVTLCGLLIYRGVTRWMTSDQNQSFGTGYDGLKQLVEYRLFDNVEWMIPIPITFVIMLVIMFVSAFFLNRTIYGRYLLALGRNEEAARFSGINTDNMIILAYVICAMLTGFAAILFSLEYDPVQPTIHGNFYELYAIAAAVLGGCSLRGGEGSIIGVVIGAAVIRTLYNANTLLGYPSSLEFALIGTVILAGVIVDEIAKRMAVQRRAARQAALEAASNN